QFNSAGKCVAADYVSGSAISQTDDKVTAMVTLVADAGTGNTVYFGANTGDANLFKDYPGSSTNTKTTFEAATKAAATELKPTAASGILMRGVYTGAVSEAAISAANLKLERLMAKVKLTYSIGGELNGTKNFKVESVRLRSVANAIYYCGTPSGKTVWPETGNHVDYAAETLAADPNSGTFVWYIPQNLQTSVKTQDATTASAAGTYIEIVGQCGLHGGNQVYYYIPVGSDGVTGTPKYDVKMNNKYDINVVLKGDNGADTRVERKPWSYSNCVMVAPSGKAYLSMPNRYTEAKAVGVTVGWAELAGTDYDVKQIWAEPGVTTTLSYVKETGRINVSVGSGEGNALIGLFPKGHTYTNNDCIWSWQIWVTDYRPDGTKKYNLGVNSKVAESNGEVHTYGSSYAA
ncbi:MAG: hypothetical protein K2K83_03365, partial [Rikenella sp.]|nr:hypothetical protein [Rikenella sp.]